MKPLRLLSIVLISCLGIIAYSNTFHCSFHLDDFASIVNNFAIWDIHDLKNIWSFLPRRFILYLSLALNYHFNGLDVFGYHLFNLAVHLISAILVWWLALLTLSTPAMKENKIAQHADLIALLAGLVFVSHPVQIEAVTYIVQRDASMATLFYLVSLSLYIKSRLLQDKNSSGVWRSYYIGSLISAVMAMFTKETAITLPLMIILYEFSFLKTKEKMNWRYLAPFFLTLFIIPITMLLTETGAARLQHLRREPGISSIHYLLTQFRVMVTYIRLVLLPFNQNLDYDYPIFKNISELPVFISLLFLAGILYSAQRLFLKYRLVSFSIFWFFLTLLPESSFLPIKDVIFEHRLYLPMVGFSLFLVSSMYYIFEKKSLKLMSIAMIMVIGSYSFLTYQRNKVWRDEFSLWGDVLQKSPHKARAYNSIGDVYIVQGNYARAMIDFKKAVEISPNFGQALSNRGACYLQEGNLIQALADYNKAIENAPDDTRAYYGRATTYCYLKEYNKAWDDVRKIKEIGSPVDYELIYKFVKTRSSLAER